MSLEKNSPNKSTAGGANRPTMVKWDGEKRSCCDKQTGGIVCESAIIKTEQGLNFKQIPFGDLLIQRR
jgi:hypothetical protein